MHKKKNINLSIYNCPVDNIRLRTLILFNSREKITHISLNETAWSETSSSRIYENEMFSAFFSLCVICHFHNSQLYCIIKLWLTCQTVLIFFPVFSHLTHTHIFAHMSLQKKTIPANVRSHTLISSRAQDDRANSKPLRRNSRCIEVRCCDSRKRSNQQAIDWCSLRIGAVLWDDI